MQTLQNPVIFRVGFRFRVLRGALTILTTSMPASLCSPWPLLPLTLGAALPVRLARPAGNWRENNTHPTNILINPFAGVFGFTSQLTVDRRNSAPGNFAAMSEARCSKDDAMSIASGGTEAAASLAVMVQGTKARFGGVTSRLEIGKLGRSGPH
jgi:hypothetical protein